jgi:hypothetical protein
MAFGAQGGRLAGRGGIVEQMENQEGAGSAGPAGDDDARDSDTNGRERALADSAGSTYADLPGTGEPRVDAALKLLDRLPGLPVGDHPELFEQVHAQLSEVLGELDSGAGAAGPAAG